jgi:hypothetical protein
VLAALAALAALSVPAAEPAATKPPFTELRLAVLPFDNLSGGPAPIDALRDELSGMLAERGVTLLDPAALRSVLAERRVRWVGGVDSGTARALWQGHQVNAVLVTHLDLIGSEDGPPRIGLVARLVGTGADGARVLWATSFDLAGEERPGLLDLGLVHDPVVLTSRALERLSSELVAYLQSGEPPRMKRSTQRRFRPRAFHAAPDVAALGAEPLRIAVLPFSNDSARRQAGEIIGYRTLAALAAIPGLTLVEPGEVRRVLLETRLIQEGGLTYSQAELLRSLLDVDLVVTGTVFDFSDPGTLDSAPIAGFTTTGIDARRRQVAWVAFSYATGLDRVYFFESGNIRTADRVADELIRGVLDAARR